ncbi:MAG: P-II family nitrogen regulator [Bernardetiaceae bacterium]
MKRVDAIVRTSRFDKVSAALAAIDVPFFTFFEVTGFGEQREKARMYRGNRYDVDYLKRTKLEILATDEDVAKIIDCILEHAYTGEVGDGKISVLPVESVYRIRTREQGKDAL